MREEEELQYQEKILKLLRKVIALEKILDQMQEEKEKILDNKTHIESVQCTHCKTWIKLR